MNLIFIPAILSMKSKTRPRSFGSLKIAPPPQRASGDGSAGRRRHAP
jgi:hypothetical protein